MAPIPPRASVPTIQKMSCVASTLIVCRAPTSMVFATLLLIPLVHRREATSFRMHSPANHLRVFCWSWLDGLAMSALALQIMSAAFCPSSRGPWVMCSIQRALYSWNFGGSDHFLIHRTLSDLDLISKFKDWTSRDGYENGNSNIFLK